jgi:hypothetical protein
MTRIFTILAAIVMAGTFAAAQTQTGSTAPKAKAQTEKAAKAPRAMTAHGSIVKSDASSLTIKTAKGEESFAIDANTKITQAGKTVTASELTSGENASVSYTKAGETMTATKIAVTPKKAVKAKAEKK